MVPPREHGTGRYHPDTDAKATCHHPARRLGRSADSTERRGEPNAQGTSAPEDFGGPGHRFCRFKTDTECWNGTGTRYRSDSTDNYPHGLVR